MRTYLAFLAVISATVATLSAQVSPARKPPEVIALKLQEDPHDPKMRIAIMKGTATPAGHRFSLEGLSILQPVAVMIFSTDRSHDLQLQLSKGGWDKAERQASTKGELTRAFRFRTQGDLQILVKSNDSSARPYFLVARVTADEVMRPMPSIFMPVESYKKIPSSNQTAAASERRAATSGPSPAVLLAVGVLAGGGLVLLTVFVMKRRGRS